MPTTNPTTKTQHKSQRLFWSLTSFNQSSCTSVRFQSDLVRWGCVFEQITYGNPEVRACKYTESWPQTSYWTMGHTCDWDSAHCSNTHTSYGCNTLCFIRQLILEILYLEAWSFFLTLGKLPARCFANIMSNLSYYVL